MIETAQVHRRSIPLVPMFRILSLLVHGLDSSHRTVYGGVPHHGNYLSAPFSITFPHHFSLPYCLWSSEGIGRLGKESIRILRYVFSELQLSQKDWPDLFLIAQSVTDNSPSLQVGDICPPTLFPGREPTPKIRTCVQKKLLQVSLSATYIPSVCWKLKPL